ncbi:hypothetical protein V6N11_048020 [Hibiscus sabdariffa]|uniref:Uncharacterized protein n=2 Tax=Hibiscus sabdariffa TaxID=183260 RepID=A0ABR2NXH0_9ROSI
MGQPKIAAINGDQPATYAIKLVSTGKNVQEGNDISGFLEQEVIITTEDIIVNNTGLIPSIHFSDKVHDQIDHNMRNSLIVRLVGRSIRFKTLQSRMLALWKPVGNIQLIDLDNNYFVV